MTPQTIDFQDLLTLVELIKSSSQFNEFKLRSGDVEIELRRTGNGMAAPAAVAAPATPAVAAAVPVAAPPPPAASASPPASKATPAPARQPSREGSTVVKAPMVGTVYRAAEPGAKPFVEVGQKVEADTQVCIIEVMKLMNSVVAEYAGVITEVLVEDGQTVEYGQELFVISAA